MKEGKPKEPQHADGGPDGSPSPADRVGAGTRLIDLARREELLREKLDTLQRQERELGERLEAEAGRSSRAGQILIATLAITILSAVIFLRAPEVAGANLPAVGALLLLAFVAVLLLVLLKTAIRATIYKLHITQRDIGDASRALAKFRSEIDSAIEAPLSSDKAGRAGESR